MSNILGNMPPVFGSGYRGVVPAPSAADVSAQNILRADGTWGAGPSGTLPSQTGNGGKLLTTDGTNASWASSLNTFQFGDVTLGTSGPSVKSSLSARAPRQGLVFDGTAQGSTATSITALGTTYSVAFWINPDNVSGTKVILNNGTRSVVYLDNAAITTPGGVATGISLTAGKMALVVLSNTAGTMTPYLNGVALSNITQSVSIEAGTYTIGGSGTAYMAGFLSPLIYNRALSASEVVALYEAGAPSGADYNSASNTSIAVAATNGNFGGFSSTATSITATSTGGVGYCYIPIPLVKGYKYRIQFTSAVAYSGNSLVWRFLGDPGSGSISGTWSNAVNCTPSAGVLQITSTSAASAEFTPDSSDSTAFLHLWEVGITAGSNVSQSGISVTRLGLLLAPDAAQAGGGLTWYDTSGNAANITLPASGVSWNVPTSGKTATGWSFNSPLLVGTTIDAGYTITARASDASIAAMSSDASSQIRLNAQSGIAILETVTNTPLRLRTNSTEAMRLFANGNVFVGASPVDGGQKLQVSGTAAITGAVTIGKDNSGSLDSSLTITATSDNADLVFKALTTSTKRNRIRFYNSLNDEQARIQSGGEVSNSYGNIVFSTSGASGLTTALTLDSSQRAIFSPARAASNIAVKIVSSGAATNADRNFLLFGHNTAANAAVISQIDNTTTGAMSLILASGTDSTGAAAALTLDSSQNATFAGKVISNGTGYGVGANSDANTPFNALTSINGTFGALIKNTNAGSSAFAGINIEADSGQAGFRQYSTAHSVWGGKTLISAPSGGTGLVLLTNGAGDAIDFWTNATQALSIDASQNIVPGTAALATTATNGFIYLQTCAGAPTGVPTTYTGRVASIYDTTNNKLYVYNGGWKSVTLA